MKTVLFKGLCRFCGGATTQFQDYLEPEWNEDGSVAGSFTIRAYEHGKCVAKDLREQDRAEYISLISDNLSEDVPPAQLARMEAATRKEWQS